MLEHDGSKMNIGNLCVKHGLFQMDLKLEFEPGAEIAFHTRGAKLPVALTGIAGDPYDTDSDDQLEDEDHTEAVMELLRGAGDLLAFRG